MRSIVSPLQNDLRRLAVFAIVERGWVFAPAAGPRGSIVAALAQRHAPFSREVAQQTGKDQGQERYSRPADATVRLRAREGFVDARVLVVAGAVVEKALDAAGARPVLHGAARGANAPSPAHPAGRERSRATALQAPAPFAFLAFVGVFVVVGGDRAAWRAELFVQGFQLRALWLDSDYLVTMGRAAGRPRAGISAVLTGPDAALGAPHTGGLQHIFCGRHGASMLSHGLQVVEVLTSLFQSPLLPTGPNQISLLLLGPVSTCRPICIVITAASYLDLIQGQQWWSLWPPPTVQSRIWPIGGLQRELLWSPVVMQHTWQSGHWPPVDSSASVVLTSGIHLGTETALWLSRDTSELL